MSEKRVVWVRAEEWLAAWEAQGYKKAGERACFIAPSTHGVTGVCPHADLPVSSPCRDAGQGEPGCSSDCSDGMGTARLARGGKRCVAVSIPRGIPYPSVAFHGDIRQ